MDKLTLLNSQWAIEPDALKVMTQFDFSRLEDPVKTFSASEEASNYKERLNEFMKQFEENLHVYEDGVASLEISGPIMPNPDPVDRYYFGACDSIRIAGLINAAAESPDIKRLMLFINSPGGMVVGTPEVGNAVRNFNESGKESIAFADTLMASAAYWIGSQATKVCSTESALVGSIGVIRPHIDATGAYDNMGLKVEIFRGGKHKVAGAMATSLSDEQREHIQAGVDECHVEFKAAVNHLRNVNDDYMQGQVFYGKDAVAKGLVDENVSGANQLIKSTHAAASKDYQSISVDKTQETMTEKPEKPEASGDKAEEVSIDTLQVELTSANSRIEELESASVDQSSRIDTLTAERDEANDKVESLEGELADAKAEAVDLQKDFDEKVDAAAKEKAESLSEEKAAKIAAQSGTDPAPIGASEGSEDEFASMSDAELWEHCSKIESKEEQRAFYVKHIQNR